jgi:hypothetical protein
MTPLRIVNPIDQTHALETLKPSYGFISTRELNDTLERHGWKPSEIKFARASEHRLGFQKHLVTYQNDSLARIEGLPEKHRSRIQLVVQNSHDGTTAFKFFLGMLRMACMNGIISGDAMASFRLIHSKRALTGLHEGVEQMVARIPEFTEQVRTLANKQLTPAQELEFIRRCYDERLKSVKGVLDVSYAPNLRRLADTGTDAFTLFNRVQEDLMRGGIAYRAARNVETITGEVVGMESFDTSTRAKASISEQVRLNRFAYNQILEVAS